ncbi:MAG: leucyl/phenylalanyl-tRNA--protein transferase [Acidimicrobiales bacterium]
MPIDPGPALWLFPPAANADESGVVGVGADLEPATLLAAYRSGLFPMPVGRRRLAWWSPDPRGVIPLGELRLSRSLRKACGRFEIRVNSAFEEVMRACSDPRRPHGWITHEVRKAYQRLHDLGWAHSVEAWTPQGRLAGGLYGVAVGGLFAGESMFHRETDASKVALVGLVELLDPHPATLLDVQWTTPHLRSLGAVDVPRAEYLRRLAAALARPLPAAFAGAPAQR